MKQTMKTTKSMLSLMPPSVNTHVWGKRRRKKKATENSPTLTTDLPNRPSHDDVEDEDADDDADDGDDAIDEANDHGKQKTTMMKWRRKKKRNEIDHVVCCCRLSIDYSHPASRLSQTTGHVVLVADVVVVVVVVEVDRYQHPLQHEQLDMTRVHPFHAPSWSILHRHPDDSGEDDGDDGVVDGSGDADEVERVVAVVVVGKWAIPRVSLVFSVC